MKKKTVRILILIAVAIVASLIAVASYAEKKCSVVNDYDGVTMTAQADSISASGMVLDIENSTSEDIVFDNDYIIEKKIYGQWYKVSSQSFASYSMEDISVIVPAGDTIEGAFSIEWLEYYGKLGSGKYRVIKTFYTPDGEDHKAAVTFTI